MNIFWKIGHTFYALGGGKMRKLAHLFARCFEILNFVVCSNAVSAKAEIGVGTKFHHHALGCVVHEMTVIGNDCHIFQNVTIGSKWPNGVCEGDAPVIGNHVFIGAGAVLLGKIKIGNDVIIGANAVVTIDVPDNCIAVGVPAVVRKRESIC